MLELYCAIRSVSDLAYGSSPISGWTSLYEAYASFVGSWARGARSLRRTKEVDGCLNAADRKELSVRRNDTLFNGDPKSRSVSSRRVREQDRDSHTREVVSNLLAKFTSQHGVQIGVCRFRECWQGWHGGEVIRVGRIDGDLLKRFV